MDVNSTAKYYQQVALPPMELSIELGHQQAPSKCFDDDGRLKRTGNE